MRQKIKFTEIRQNYTKFIQELKVKKYKIQEKPRRKATAPLFSDM